MAEFRTKPIHELERKVGITDQDLILILDAETGEAKLADKEELRGHQGEQGIQGPKGTSISEINPTKEGKITTLVIKKSDGTSKSFQLLDGVDGKNPEFQFSETHLQQRLEGEETWINLIPLSEIRGGTITNIERTGGTGAPGSTDTYTITLSDGINQTFQVYNGKDGDGSGDMISTNNLSDLKDKAKARTNLGAESEWNKKQSIEAHKDSHTFFPTIKAVFDWVIGLLTKKADLINGKVPAEQLPEVSQIDESNLVHKNGDETITGKKVFSGGIALSDGKIYLRNHGDNNHYIVFDGSAGNGGDGMRIHEVGGLTFSTVSGDAVKIKQDRSLELYSNMIIPQNASIFVGGNDILGEWQSWTPTNGSATITDHHCRYKIIGKTCHFIAQVYVNNVAGNTPGFTLPIPRANYVTEFMVAGYCVRRGENPATQSRGAISFSGREGVFTLGSTDVGTFTQPGEYIIRASGSYETA